MIAYAIARDWRRIDPSQYDKAVHEGECAGLWVETGGSISVVPTAQRGLPSSQWSPTTFNNVAQGFFPLRIHAIASAGTSAVGLIAVYI